MWLSRKVQGSSEMSKKGVLELRPELSKASKSTSGNWWGVGEGRRGRSR